MRFFVTKYALTEGIMVVSGEVEDGMLRTFGGSDGSRPMYFHGEGKEWHRTESQAMLRAEMKRRAKLKSLRKSITKLEAMTFKVIDR